MKSIFDEPGYSRLVDIIAPKGPFPISRSTWWAGVRTGRYPKPVKLGPGITAWNNDVLAALARSFEDGNSNV